MTVICAKLNTGEEIIAKVVTQPSQLMESGGRDLFSGDVYDVPVGPVVLEDVRSVTLVPAGGGRQAIGFMPFSLANQDVSFKIDLGKYAIAVFAPHEQLLKAYLGEPEEAVKGKIQLATESGLAKAGIRNLKGH